MNSNPQTTAHSLLVSGLKEEQKNNPIKAIELYTLAINIDPKNEEAVRRISNIFIAHKEHRKAIEPLKYLSTIAKKAHIAHFNLAACYTALGEQLNAENNYLQAIKREPNFWIAYALYTDILIRQKRLDAAENFLNEAREKHGVQGELEWAIAKVMVNKELIEKAIPLFEKAIDLGIQKEFNAKMLSDYAFALEKVKNYAKSFEYHCKAQALFKRSNSHLPKNTSFHDITISKSLKYVKREECKNWTTEKLDNHLDPIFIIGFPRSGTTLCEQVLHSHSHLITTDELEVIKEKSVSISEILGRHMNHIRDWSKLTEHDIITWRASYFDEMAKRIRNYSPKLRIVDKLPIQIVHLATIRRFFPNSPIIMMKRDPRDSCLSNFFQTFEHNEMTNNFYDIKSTFKYYARVMKCYKHLKTELDLNLLEVKYEEICDDFESHARTIINHIGEPWEDNVLEYYKEKNARFVSTPSYSAITNTVNKNAVGKWCHYRDNIQSHVSIIKPFIKDFGYE